MIPADKEVALAYRYRVFLAIALTWSIAGCAHQPPAAPMAKKPVNYAAPLPPGQMALRKIAPNEYPDFSDAIRFADFGALKLSTQYSLQWLARPSSQRAYPYLDITHDRAVASLNAFLDLLQTPGLQTLGSIRSI
jgi:hypothetical protein